MRILVIEDERRLADTICAILRERGFDTDAAYDGESGEAYRSSSCFSRCSSARS